jgi:hypothetical protein
LGLERDRDMGRDRDWDRDRDRTFCCGPSRGIWLSDVAPPGGSTFRCGPSRRIESYGVALPMGSTATLWDRSNILWEHAVAFKGTVYEKCVYGRTIQPKAYNIHALDRSSLKKKADHPGGATPWDQQQIQISRWIQIYIRNGFRMGIRGLGDVFLLKKPEAKFLVTLSFKDWKKENSIN